MKKKHKFRSICADIFFYVLLISMIGIALRFSHSKGPGPRVFGGYSAYVVLTGSMEDVIPKGSLVVTRYVDPQELQVGDDITYMVSESATVTHRIIEIVEADPDSGEREFRTQGVMNKEPDRNLVAAVNVVGKVIYHNQTLGTVVSFGQENWPLVIFLIMVLLAFVKAAESILKREEIKDQEKLQKEETIQPTEDIVFEIVEL